MRIIAGVDPGKTCGIACMAALFAYKKFLNKFKQAEHIATERKADAEEIKTKIVARYSIKEALENRKSNRK